MVLGWWLPRAASLTAVLSFMLLVLPMRLFAAPAAESAAEAPGFRVEEVIASPEDPRAYRALAYDNGLQVLLVRDPAATEANWALSVLAGANQDPVALPGLNNLLALVLYSDPAANINVQPEHTEYHLRAPTNALATALTDFFTHIDRSAEIPLEEIERGQHLLANNIRSGLGATLTDRRDDVFSALFNAEHPMARRQGASASIAQLPVVTEALQKNFKRLYTPARMRLALVANLPLDRQQSIVTAALSRLSQKAPGTIRDANYPPLFTPQTLPIDVQIQADIAKPQLQLLFPVPNPLALYAEKPLAEVSRLLADGGPGSLLALLKSLGWADTIDTGMGMQSRYDGLFEVRIDLTDLGVRAKDQVVALVFYMLDQIRVRGLREWRHLELARTAALDFRYRDASAVRDPAQLAHALHYYRPRDVLYGPFRYNEFNERLVRRYLDFLRSDNVLVSLTSTAAVAGEQRSPVLLTPYSAVKSSEAQPDIKITVRRRLDFPERNNFIPTRLSTKEAPMLPTSQNTGINEVVELFNRPRFSAWFNRGHIASPAASVLLRLEIPAAGASALAAAEAELMAELVRQELNEKAFAAHLAGVDFTVQPHALGLDVHVHGYNSQLGLMLTRIDQVLDDAEITDRRFKRAQDMLAERLTMPRNTLDSILRERLDRLHYRPSWTRAERAEALASITPDQLRNFKHVHYRPARLSILFYGNLYRQEAQRLAALSEHYFLEDDAGAPRTATYGRLSGGKGPQLNLPTRDGSGVALYLQGRGASAVDYAQMQLAAQLLRESLTAEPENIADQFVIKGLVAGDDTAEGASGAIADTTVSLKSAADESSADDSQREAHSVTPTTTIDPANIAVFDWLLAGRPALVVYWAGEIADGAALREFVRQELARQWPSAAIAEAQTVVGRRLANDSAGGLREKSTALWRELVDATMANTSVMTEVAGASVASSERYRRYLAERVAGALTLTGAAEKNAPSSNQKALDSYWNHLQKQPLQGPVLP
ncbi:insulinase family protein [uncultured Gilvimarinus sp.]|uniref:insulinase family protein n=1 Tax=uncultured Gilvimarinus sp. TaxID=1689143 RepID=UPI0030DADA2F